MIRNDDLVRVGQPAERVHTSYLICATPRSGSYLLCEALTNSGLAGHPAEYFWREHEPRWAARWGTSDHREYVAAEEHSWHEYFSGAGIVPLTVVYEDLVDAYEATATWVLGYLGIAVPPNLTFSPRHMRQQAGAHTDAWVERYHACWDQEPGARDGTGPTERM